MSRLLLIMLLLWGTLAVAAQEVPEGFDSFEDSRYGLQGIIPEGWTTRGFGTYGRGQSATDVALLTIQSAPLDRARLVETLQPRLGRSTLPEAAGQITTDAFVWDDFIMEVEAAGMELRISLALTEVEGTTYLVLLQSLADEHDDLRESVYRPVVESMALYNADEADDTDDVPCVAE